MKSKSTLPLLITLILTTFSPNLFAEGTYSGGSGTAEDPYLIATAEDMNEIGENSDDWDAHFLLTADINLIDYNETNFNIIGHNSTTPFTGVFDGNGHTISNFTYESNSYYVGLFGYAGQGSSGEPNVVIKNLTLKDPNVSGDDSVGAIVGCLSEGTLTNCSAVDVNISGRSAVGGLVGQNGNIENYHDPNTYTYGTIENCYATGTVSAERHSGGLVGCNGLGTISDCNANCSVSGKQLIGGLTGSNSSNGRILNSSAIASVSATEQLTGGLTGYNTGEILNCYVAGTVDGNEMVGGLAGCNGYYSNSGNISDSFSAAEVSGVNEVGGLVGRLWTGSITGSCATGSVHGNDMVGGMVGQLFFIGTISECFAAGNVSGNEFVGGLLGYNHYYDNILSNCYATGDVTGIDYTGGLLGYNNSMEILSCHATGNVTGIDYTGGLIGYSNEGEISYCYAQGSVSGYNNTAGLAGYIDACPVMNSYSTGNVSGINNTGGLLGYADSKSIYRDGRYYYHYSIISHCYSSSNVEGNDCVGGLLGHNRKSWILTSCATGDVIGDSNVGGLTGYNYYGYISNCYATSSVTGDEYVGGLCGTNYSGTISNCYATGSVDGYSTLGGLCGKNHVGVFGGFIINSFWDMQTSKQRQGIGFCDYSGPMSLYGKSTAEMMTETTFTDYGWDFVGETDNGTEDIWKIDVNDYPRLWWEIQPVDLVIELSGNISAMSLKKGIENSLLVKLDTVIKILQDGDEDNDAAAINSLQAFINAVEAQSGKKISQEDADGLIEAAQQIIELLSDG